MPRSFVVAVLLVLLLHSEPVAGQGTSPCHGEAKFEESSCTVVTLPPGLCSACRIGDYHLTGPFQGSWLDCQRTYHVEEPQCLAALQEYVDLNPCDDKRRIALEGYNNDNNKEYGRQVLDFFAYSICENPCDCIPQENVDRDVPAYDVHRGNCQSHPYYDVCAILPDIQLIRLEGTVDDSATRHPMCPLVVDWFNSSASLRWFENPHTTVDPRVEGFLDRMMEATQFLQDLPFYQSCVDLELTQRRVAPVGGLVTNQAIHINAGLDNADFVDEFGRFWARDDKYVTGGQTSVNSSPIAGTTADTVYHYGRWGTFTYDIPVSNGEYHVVIHEAEVSTKNFAVGKRLFDISIEGGQAFWVNVDIYQLAGGAGNTAVELAANVTVSDQLLTIAFTQGIIEQPRVAGIAVIPMLLYNDYYASLSSNPTPPASVPTLQPFSSNPTWFPSLAPVVPSSPTNTPQTTTLYRINAGELNLDKTIDGEVWLKDQYFTGGKTSGHGTPPIADTTADELYHQERWGQFTYNFPVSSVTGNERFQVVIYLAELTNRNQASAKRVFTINVEDQVTFPNVDIFSTVGGYTAYLLTASDIAVSDGLLTVQFLKTPIEQPKVSALQVLQITTATSPPPLLPSPPPPPPASQGTYINAGATVDMTIDGILWLKDQYYVRGRTATPTSLPIANTTFDVVYHTERWGDSRYDIPVPASGAYQVTLYLAEVTNKNQGVGKRVFGVRVENQVTWNDIDIYQRVGGYTAYQLETQVTVSDGFATIEFLKSPVEHPKVSGLRVLPVAVPPPPPPAPFAIYINAGELGQDLMVDGTLWLKDQFYTGGKVGSPATTAIAQTTADVLFQTERWGQSVYRIPVPVAGDYVVTLFFSETNGKNFAPRQRLFSVQMQGTVVFAEIDIFAQSGGGYTALQLSHTVTVTHGILTVEFVDGAIEFPKICAMSVVTASSGSSSTGTQ